MGGYFDLNHLEIQYLRAMDTRKLTTAPMAAITIVFRMPAGVIFARMLMRIPPAVLILADPAIDCSCIVLNFVPATF